MWRTVAVLVGVVGVIALSAGPAGAAGGPTVEQLENAGWTCVPLASGIHCLAPGGALTGPGVGQNNIYFKPVTNEFAGTELLLFTSLDLTGIPCPGPEGVWHFVGFAWACHHPAGAP
jgi:hypothetical protein